MTLRYQVEFLWADNPLKGWQPRASFAELNDAHMYCHTRSLTWPNRHWRVVDMETLRIYRYQEAR